MIAIKKSEWVTDKIILSWDSCFRKFRLKNNEPSIDFLTPIGGLFSSPFVVPDRYAKGKDF